MHHGPGPDPVRPQRMRVGPPLLLGVLLLIALGLLCTRDEDEAGAEGPAFARLRALPADSAEARAGVIRSDPASVRATFDSLLAFSRPGDAALLGLLDPLAREYLSVTRDSVLVRDLAFVTRLPAGQRAVWGRGVQAEDAATRLQGAKDYAGAAAGFAEAVRLYREAGDLRREAVALGSRGVALWLGNDFAGAGAAYREALAARERLGDPVLVGRTQNALGSVAQQTGDYRGALDWYEKARATRERAGDRAGLGTTLAYLGNVRYLLGDLEEARARYLESIEVFGAGAPPAALVPARVGLANVHWSLGEYREALELYRVETTRLERENDPRKLALAKRNMAQAEWRLGDYASALRGLAEARELQESAGDRAELARTLNSIAGIQYDLGENAKALEAFQASERQAREAGNEREAGRSLLNAGAVFGRMGLHERALETYDRAREILEKSGDRTGVSEALVKVAAVKSAGGRPAEALEILREGLRIAEEEESPPAVAGIRIEIANSLGALGRLEESRAEFRTGIALAGSLGRADLLRIAYLGLADGYEAEGSLDSARVNNERALDLVERFRSTELSEAERTGYLARQALFYEAQVNLLAKLDRRAPDGGWATEAFRTAERGKARVLLDLLAEARVDLDAGVEPSLAAERAALERAMRAVEYRRGLASDADRDSAGVLDRRRRDLAARREAVLERIRTSNPRVATLDAGRPMALGEIREGILPGKRTALLEYALGDSASHLWTVTRKEIRLFTLPKRGEIENEVGVFRAALLDPSPAGVRAFVASSRRLHDLLLAPAAKILGGAEDVYIVPDGALHRLPFEALLSADPPVWPDAKEPAAATSPADAPGAGARDAATPGGPPGTWLAGLRYALEGKSVRYGPSATTLAILSRERRGGAPPAGGLDLLAVGDPVFTGTMPPVDPGGAPGGTPEGIADRNADRAAPGDLAPLPWTREEVTAIGALFPEDRRTLLLGRDAREKTLLAPGFLGRFRILHFATHGIVDERRPERSRLVLSRPADPDEDGALEASEIYRTRIDADLVVLSACETGLGRVFRGEGVLGLPRAFLFAGASSVVLSLWSVSDRSTSEFMRACYTEMVKEGRSPAAALARARKALKSDPSFAHPFHWAPFVLMGVG